MREKITITDVDDIRICDLSSLARTAAQCTDIGSQLLGQALGIEKLYERLDSPED